MKLTWEFDCSRHGPQALAVETETGRMTCTAFHPRELPDAIAAHLFGDGCECTRLVQEYRNKGPFVTSMGEVGWWRGLSAVPTSRALRRWLGREVRPVVSKAADRKGFEYEALVEELVSRDGAFAARSSEQLQVSLPGCQWWPVSITVYAVKWLAVVVSDYLPVVFVPVSSDVGRLSAMLLVTVQTLVLAAQLTQTTYLNDRRLRRATAARVRAHASPNSNALRGDVVLDVTESGLTVNFSASQLTAGQARLLVDRLDRAIAAITHFNDRRPQ